jgi:hypothetical protein
MGRGEGERGKGSEKMSAKEGESKGEKSVN